MAKAIFSLMMGKNMSVNFFKVILREMANITKTKNLLEKAIGWMVSWCMKKNNSNRKKKANSKRKV